MPKKRILYAEDDADDRFIFEECFLAHEDEVEIVLFKNGQELINYLEANHNPAPNVVVLDINMPVLDGKETLRILREKPEYADLPIVMLTTSSSSADQQFAKLFNAGFMTKPMDEPGMKKIARELISYCG